MKNIKLKMDITRDSGLCHLGLSKVLRRNNSEVLVFVKLNCHHRGPNLMTNNTDTALWRVVWFPYWSICNHPSILYRCLTYRVTTNMVHCKTYTQRHSMQQESRHAGTHTHKHRSPSLNTSKGKRKKLGAKQIKVINDNKMLLWLSNEPQQMTEGSYLNAIT